MSKRLFAMIVVAMAWAPATVPCRAAGALTTAPVDYSLYREGEVQRLEQHYASWLLTCDEIRRLGRKFCSLRSVARSTDGTIVAALTVSTDEGGRPAAIVTLPFGTSLAAGLHVAASSKSRRKGAEGAAFKPTECGGMGCQVVWPISGDEIGDLRAGHAIRLEFKRNAGSPAFPGLLASRPMTSVEGTVEATGFADALTASMR